MVDYLLVKLPRVYKVEDLHEGESIEDKGEMPGIYHSGIVDSHVVVSSSDGVEAATSDRPSNDSIQPLAGRVLRKDGGIVGIDIFRNELFSPEDQDDHHNELEDALANDVFEHGRWDDVLVPGMGVAVQ